MTTMTRRQLLQASGTAGLVLSAPAFLTAQSKEPIPIGTLCPLTGAGGSYGPDMQRSVVAVVERINNAGGISGRPIQLFHEDDQTNAEAGVRAARKLIDVNRVVAIVATWASAVTLAVKPLCVEARVFVIGVSGADSVTQGDHKGFIARTQPNTNLQGRMYGKFAASKKEWKRVAYMALQTPFAQSFGEAFTGVVKAAGATITDSHIYEDKKPSYRSELTRVLATNPDLIMIEGYTPDSVVMAKDLYRAAYKGAVLAPSFAINAKFIEGVGAEVAEGVWNMDRAPLFDSPAFKEFSAAVPGGDQSPYAPQAWDQMTLVALALAAGKGDVSGGILALPAVAFSLLWRLLRFPNFAVSTYLTVGAYVALVLNHGVRAPIEVAWLSALVVTGAVALGVDRIAFRPMRSRRPFSLAIASIGVAFILENVVRFVWGNDFRSYDVPVSRAMSVAGLRIGREQLLILGVAVGVMALAPAFLLRTRLGIAMRATADNALLAAAKGVPTERVIAAATLGGGALAGGAGVFLGLDASIDPLMGGGLIISVFAAAILGGIGSAPGALAGALIVGIVEEVGMLVVPPTYKTAIGFVIILAVLLVRPTGLAGARS